MKVKTVGADVVGKADLAIGVAQKGRAVRRE